MMVRTRAGPRSEDRGKGQGHEMPWLNIKPHGDSMNMGGGEEEVSVDYLRRFK